MGYRRIETLIDVARQGFYLQLTCDCGHTRKLDPQKLLLRLTKRGASTRLDRLNETIKCSRCGSKTFRAAHCNAPPDWS